MKRIISTVLLIAGVLLIGFGIYSWSAPKNVVEIGKLEIKAQDKDGNQQALIFVGLGVACLIGGGVSLKGS